MTRRSFVKSAAIGGLAIPTSRLCAENQLTLQSSVTIANDASLQEVFGNATFIRRGFTVPDGQGMVNVLSQDCTIRDLTFDGATTTPTGLVRYVDFWSPLDTVLSRNTTLWIKGGTKRLLVENVTFQHSGGFSVIIDARTADIEDVSFLNCSFLNNRPHLHGTTSDLNYGSWTGGLLWVNDGRTGGVIKNLTIQNCTFARNTGNCCWGWSRGFQIMNENINIIGCSFTDCGLDAVGMNNVAGGSVTRNSFYRIGYIAVDDSTPAVPKYDPGYSPIAIDTTTAKRLNYTFNKMLQINGGGICGDGLGESTIANNEIAVSDSSEPLYDSDQVRLFGPHGIGNQTFGIQSSNTFFPEGGTDLEISDNTVRNMGMWAVALCNAKHSVVRGNRIDHPITSGGEPIILLCYPGYDYELGTTLLSGNDEGAQPNHRSYDNTITDNSIDYTGTRYCIAEIDYSDGITIYTFKDTDVNRVNGNCVSSANYGEFIKNPNSGSYAEPERNGSHKTGMTSRNHVARRVNERP
jgi:Right handed beta helix region